MPKRQTYPTEIEDLPKLSAKTIKKTFSSGGAMLNYNFAVKSYLLGETASIEIAGESVQGLYIQKIEMVSRKSNINNGLIWYFICPKTGKRCSKLYLYRGLFLHRSAIPCNYSDQNEARKYRLLKRMFRVENGLTGDEIFKKHFKTKYAGKYTKRYLRIIAKIQREQQKYELDYLELMRLTNHNINNLKF